MNTADSEYQRGYLSGFDRASAESKQEIDRLRAAVVSLGRLWPAERWATLSGICRDHPVIDEVANLTRGTSGI